MIYYNLFNFNEKMDVTEATMKEIIESPNFKKLDCKVERDPRTLVNFVYPSSIVALKESMMNYLNFVFIYNKEIKNHENFKTLYNLEKHLDYIPFLFIPLTNNFRNIKYKEFLIPAYSSVKTKLKDKGIDTVYEFPLLLPTVKRGNNFLRVNRYKDIFLTYNHLNNIIGEDLSQYRNDYSIKREFLHRKIIDLLFDFLLDEVKNQNELIGSK